MGRHSNAGSLSVGAWAMRMAGMAEQAGPDTWTRGLTIGETRNDVRRMLEYALHDSVHHLDDVERGLAQLRATRRTK